MSGKDDTWEMLMFKLAQQRQPEELKALKSTYEVNAATQKLTEETLKHFKDSKKSSNNSLIVSGLLSIITVCVLVIQTFTSQEVLLQHPISLEEKQVQAILESQAKGNTLLIQQVDSLTKELQRLDTRLNSTNANQ